MASLKILGGMCSLITLHLSQLQTSEILQDLESYLVYAVCANKLFLYDKRNPLDSYFCATNYTQQLHI